MERNWNFQFSKYAYANYGVCTYFHTFLKMYIKRANSKVYYFVSNDTNIFFLCKCV